jgi:hypothetical protein
MFRLGLGLAVGYVLGAKAGRGRYEQIVRFGSKAADSPAVQGAAGFLRAKASDVISLVLRRKDTRPDTAYLIDNDTALSTATPGGPVPLKTVS